MRPPSKALPTDLRAQYWSPGGTRKQLQEGSYYTHSFRRTHGFTRATPEQWRRVRSTRGRGTVGGGWGVGLWRRAFVEQRL